MQTQAPSVRQCEYFVNCVLYLETKALTNEFGKIQIGQGSPVANVTQLLRIQWESGNLFPILIRKGSGRETAISKIDSAKSDVSRIRGLLISCMQGGLQIAPGGIDKLGSFDSTKGLLCGNPTERGEVEDQVLAGSQFISPLQGALIVGRKKGGGVVDTKKTTHLRFTLSKLFF